MFWLRGTVPPFLIIHGEKNQVVPLAQSQAFCRRLLNTGNSAPLVVVRNAGHDLMPDGGRPDPSLSQLADRIADFLDDTLGTTRMAQSEGTPWQVHVTKSPAQSKPVAIK